MTEPKDPKARASAAITPRAQRFIDLVVEGRTLADAAHEAGYCPNSDDAAASSWGSKLRRQYGAEIEARLMAAAQRADLSAEATVRETARHAYFDPQDIVSWGPDGLKIRPSEELTPELRRCVKEVSCDTIETEGPDGSVTKRTKVRVQLVDRQAALARLAEYQGLTGGNAGIPLAPGDAAAAKEAEEQLRSLPRAELLARWAKRRGLPPPKITPGA